jgi:hypothetical protein
MEVALPVPEKQKAVVPLRPPGFYCDGLSRLYVEITLQICSVGGVPMRIHRDHGVHNRLVNVAVAAARCSHWPLPRWTCNAEHESRGRCRRS